MAVKFLPADSLINARSEHTSERDTESLAEVIDMRSRLVVTEATRESISDFAIKTLARKAMSSGELAKALHEAEYEDFQVEETIAEFVQNLYLDDLGLARVLGEKLRQTKKLSKAQIRAELSKRLIPAEIIANFLAELDGDQETALLRELAAKRALSLRDLPRDTAKRRLHGYLARRGWSGPETMRVIDEVLNQSS